MPDASPPLDISMAPVAILPVAGFWWLYYFASIRTDETGITQHTLFKRTTILWSEVRAYRLKSDLNSPWRTAVIVGDRKIMKIWLGIADADDLKAEVARRAVNSRTRKWRE